MRLHRDALPRRLTSALNAPCILAAVYPKVHRDLTKSTSIGGGISVVGLLVMSVLFFTEFSAYLNTRLVRLADGGAQRARLDDHLTVCPCAMAVGDDAGAGRQR